MTNNDRGPSLFSKYVWVIETIYRAKSISFKDLNEKWINTELSRGMEIPKRTFDNWKYAIWDMFGIDIVNENRGEYRYYISNAEDIGRNGICSWLYNTLCVSNTLANSLSIKDRIVLEYVPSGQEYLQTIIDAMKGNRVVNITHYNYWKDREYNFDVQPFGVKPFRQRWYLIGRSTSLHFYEQGPRIYSLDRLRHIHITEETFGMPKGWNAKEYFESCYGIIVGTNKEIETVRLKVSTAQANYIRDLPLHESQKETERNEAYRIFTYRMRTTFDFLQELLWNGDHVEVLVPNSLRKEMTEMTERMWSKYKGG